MKTICGWCKCLIKDGPNDEISHGICEGCSDRVLHAPMMVPDLPDQGPSHDYNLADDPRN